MKRFLPLVAFSFLLDLATTGVAFLYGAVESNPFLSNLNYPAIVAVKGGVFVAISWYLTHPGKGINTATITAWFAIMATYAVSMSNIIQLATHVNPSYMIAVPLTALVMAAGCLQIMIKPGPDAPVGNV